MTGYSTDRPPRSWMHRGPFLIALVIVTGLSAAGAAWHEGTADTRVNYATAAVTQGPVVRAITASGTVNPVVTVQVGTYVSGVIQSIACDYNTKVVRGQLCARIDPRPYQTVVDQDRANLAAAKAQLEKDQTSLGYADMTYRRNLDLGKRGLVTQDTVDSTKSLADQARAQVEVDRTTIAQRQAALSAAVINLGYTDIISPVDGTVVSRNVTTGQTVAASFQTPTLFLIAADLTRMQVDASVSESDIGGVAVGHPASFTVEAFPNETFRGTVTQVRQAPQTVQNVVTYDAVISVANPELKLKPGMTATVRIVSEARANVTRVPDEALRYRPGGAATVPATFTGASPGNTARRSAGDHVWVLRDGRAVRVPVMVGLDDDTYAEILHGDIRPGDRVIISERGRADAAGAASTSTGPRLRF